MSDNEFSTTFWSDFTIADAFGADAVQDTFNRAFHEWRDDYRYLTDLVIVTNHKLWQWYEAGDSKLAHLYDSLWREAEDYACNHLEGDELAYFYRMTD